MNCRSCGKFSKYSFLDLGHSPPSNAFLKKKSEIENMEDIEILRFFDLGIKIKMVKLNSNSVAVDEISDVKKVEKIIRFRKKNFFSK